ncbi:growth factor receptor-bound protein 14 [Columba livia]|uniref:Growth factor receptor-bound protein 14 n=1 Tax=Columba livia TaxID=8932 RepID=A0A2I0MIG1_COLLI|nr:growth factor receptor-bound protein 14 [Columba livia]
MAVTGCCEWSEVQSRNVLFSLAAGWAAGSEALLVIDGFLKKSILMIKQSCSNINGNASQLLIECFLCGLFYTIQLKITEYLGMYNLGPGSNKGCALSNRNRYNSSAKKNPKELDLDISQFEVTEPSRYSLSAVSRNVREINGFPLSDAAVVAISGVHLVRKKKDDNILEIPSIPNPFPELCCSPFASVLSTSLLPKATSRKKQVIKVYSEDDTSRALEVPRDITARDVCQLLILKNHYIDDHSWTLFEQLTHTGLGRAIEDHELVMEVQSNWIMEEENKLYFRKNYAKYEFFKNPLGFFPDHMISFPSETSAAVSHSGILQMFLSSSTYPEIHGYLYAKEQGKKSWKKLYFILRRSGLYFSTKGTSKEPRHLQFFCEFSNSDMYMSLTGKKISGAPTNYGFCFKPNKSGGTRDLKQLCADDEQTRTCWMTAIRLLKYGMQLYQNYMQPYQGRSGCSPLNLTPMRSISENSLVAMDFSGHRSRIIENPTEALSVAVEEGLAWRRRGCLRLNSHGSPIAMSNMAIHRSQSWFHHKISREEAQRLILQHGLVDGVFLVRDSQSNPKTFVLSLSHGLKIKHFQIVPLEDDGKLFYTLDDGHTRFTDLIQLVEFYQLNKGVLPCKLKHYCARIAL